MGVYPLTITARSSTGSATQAFTLTVSGPPTIKSISRKPRPMAGASDSIVCRRAAKPRRTKIRSHPWDDRPLD